MSDLLKYLLVIVISYFIGNFAPSYFMGKILKILTSGSMAAEMLSNQCLRVLGTESGVVVFILDILKAICHKLACDTGSKLGGMLAGVWPMGITGLFCLASREERALPVPLG